MELQMYNMAMSWSAEMEMERMVKLMGYMNR